MRELKFRTWDSKTKKWLGLMDKFTISGESDYWYRWIEGFCGNILCLSNDEGAKISQFTGLHDMNNKEIYEGDIVRMENFGQPKQAIAIVVYQGSGFVPRKHKSTTWYEWCPIKDQEGKSWEVIGNIYENKELLNV